MQPAPQRSFTTTVSFTGLCEEKNKQTNKHVNLALLSTLFARLIPHFSIDWNSGYCFSSALIRYSISEYPALFTDTPPVPPSERRQIRASGEKNAFPVCCSNQQRHFTTNQSSCSRNTRRRWRSLEILTGKALYSLLEFIHKTSEKDFCLQMQIKLKSCITL